MKILRFGSHGSAKNPKKEKQSCSELLPQYCGSTFGKNRRIKYITYHKNQFGK